MSSRRQIQRKLKLAGLALQVSAVQALESVLKHEDAKDEKLVEIVKEIKARIEREGLTTVVDLSSVQAVVAELSKNELDREQESIVVVDAFAVPLALLGAPIAAAQ